MKCYYLKPLFTRRMKFRDSGPYWML